MCNGLWWYFTPVNNYYGNGGIFTRSDFQYLKWTDWWGFIQIWQCPVSTTQLTYHLLYYSLLKAYNTVVCNREVDGTITDYDISTSMKTVVAFHIVSSENEKTNARTPQDMDKRLTLIFVKSSAYWDIITKFLALLLLKSSLCKKFSARYQYLRFCVHLWPWSTEQMDTKL